MTGIAKHAQGANAAKPQRFFARPADRSLTAYKEWIGGMYKALVTQVSLPADQDNMTEEDWVSSRRHFWKGSEKETGQE